MLLLPDLLGYWLTGRRVSEATNSSTTGLLDVHTRQWDWDLVDRVGLPRSLFEEVGAPGDIVGSARSSTKSPLTQASLVARR